MKRQTQVLGVRNWYGDAFVSLQEEPLKVIDGFFSQYGAFVLSGCEVKANGSKYDIAPGLVVLEGAGANNATVKVVVPFAGITATALPVYLTLGYETETDVYNDGNVKPIAHIYKAVATTVKPAGSYVQITQTGGVRFIDAIQDATHRFITDNERESWKGKVDKVPGKGLSTNDYTDEDKKRVQGTAYYDYVVDSNEKLQDLHNNANATNVLIKTGTWYATSEIGIHPNCRAITGEAGSRIVVTLSSGYGNDPNPLSALYAMDATAKTRLINVSAEVKASGITQYVAVFRKFNDMEGCVAVSDQSPDKNKAIFGYKDCDGLRNCKASISMNWRGEATQLYVYGFYQCKNLDYCAADVKLQSLVVSSTNRYVNGFRECDRFSNCRTTVESVSEKISAIGFAICTFLNGCYAFVKGNGNYVKNAFYNCENLANCQGEIDENSEATNLTSVFYGCKNVMNCKALSSQAKTYGFDGCYYVSYCTANNAGYSASVGGSGSQRADDTQAGGWNKTVK